MTLTKTWGDQDNDRIGKDEQSKVDEDEIGTEHNVDNFRLSIQLITHTQTMCLAGQGA